MHVARITKWGLLTLFVLSVAISVIYEGLNRFGAVDAIRSAQVNLVDDRAELLTSAQRDQIIEFHTAIRNAYDIDFRVAIVSGSPDVNLAAADLFAALAIGELSATGRGLLLLIAPDTDAVRVEVGRGLEPVFTDAFVSYIEERQMVPFFQASRVSDGILATTELFADRAAEGLRTAAFADPADETAEPSAGGGARAVAQIGAGYQRPVGASGGVPAAGLGPREVVEAYLRAMAAGNTDPNLDIFTDTTREMMRNWVLTRAQMRQIARAYKSCSSPRVFQSAALAVVRYEVDERTCAPYFLRLSGTDWRLDLTLMSSAIRFNHRNEWRFATGGPTEFSFAFEDWRFDANGFPID